MDLATAAKLEAPAPTRKIWAIGGGKGGIGKSFMISNIAITLARGGNKVVIVDLDLGGANLHTCLGCDIPKQTLSDFFSGRVTTVEQLLVQSPVERIQFISGANDSVSATNITNDQVARLMRGLLTVPCDYLLIDLGAGTHDSTLDFFLMADRPLIGITPEPTSIENAYRFIKAAYFRWIKTAEDKLGIASLVDHAMDHKNNFGIKTPVDLVNRIAQTNPGVGEKFRDLVGQFKVFMLMNQVRTQNDAEMGEMVSSVCKKYFGIGTEFVGYLEYDNAVWQSVRKRRPLILEYPYSNLVHQFSQVVKRLEDDERHS